MIIILITCKMGNKMGIFANMGEVNFGLRDSVFRTCQKYNKKSINQALNITLNIAPKITTKSNAFELTIGG